MSSAKLQQVEEAKARVADKWSAYEPEQVKTYFGFPGVRAYRIRSAFGPSEVERYRCNARWPEDIVVDKYLSQKQIQSVLSLCCGFGRVEQHMIPRLGTVRRCLAVDIAPGAVDAARQRAAEAGLGEVITYRVADLNHFEWEPAEYDLVIANGALHHLANLEQVFTGIKQTLKPDGILHANEHVGAPHQDYPTRQIELINALAYLIPPELRSRRLANQSHSRMGKAVEVLFGLRSIPDPAEKPRWSAPKKLAARLLRSMLKSTRRRRVPFGILHDSQKQHLLETDPSEGVRSSEIIPLMRQYFSKVHVHQYGGSLLAYALDRRFCENYQAENPEHVRLLELLCALEEYYITTGAVPIEHAILIAEP